MSIKHYFFCVNIFFTAQPNISNLKPNETYKNNKPPPWTDWSSSEPPEGRPINYWNTCWPLLSILCWSDHDRRRWRPDALCGVDRRIYFTKKFQTNSFVWSLLSAVWPAFDPAMNKCIFLCIFWVRFSFGAKIRWIYCLLKLLPKKCLRNKKNAHVSMSYKYWRIWERIELVHFDRCIFTLFFYLFSEVWFHKKISLARTVLKTFSINHKITKKSTQIYFHYTLMSWHCLKCE